VFHSPQASHLPSQRPNAAPQFWQTNVWLRRDIDENLGKNQWGPAQVYGTEKNITRTFVRQAPELTGTSAVCFDFCEEVAHA
jgi:hypothetical protein